MNKERRSIQVQSEGNRLVGYCAVWDSPTTITEGRNTFVEVIRRGAFSKSLKDDVIATYNHDYSRLLGRVSSGTLRLTEDNHGLRFEVDLPESAVDIKELVQRKDLVGGSFTFSVRVGGEKWNKDSRELLDLVLHEVAPVVVMPAYSSTSVNLRSKNNYKQKLRLYEMKI
jgi:uncharacterized protein